MFNSLDTVLGVILGGFVNSGMAVVHDPSSKQQAMFRNHTISEGKFGSPVDFSLKIIGSRITPAIQTRIAEPAILANPMC